MPELKPELVGLCDMVRFDPEDQCRRLRGLVQDCLSSGLHASAVFYADKLVTLSKGCLSDTYLLAQVNDALHAGGASALMIRGACTSLLTTLRVLVHPPLDEQCYHASKQYRRALALLRREGMPDALHFKCLIATCLAEVKDWEECLAVLGDSERDDDMASLKVGPSPSGGRRGEAKERMHARAVPAPCGTPAHAQDAHQKHLGGSVSTAATVCFLRGRAFEALENRARAISCYRDALQLDPYCYEAFNALVGNHMLTNDEELQLLEGITALPGDDWLKMMYRCRCKKVRRATRGH